MPDPFTDPFMVWKDGCNHALTMGLDQTEHFACSPERLPTKKQGQSAFSYRVARLNLTKYYSDPNFSLAVGLQRRVSGHGS